MSTILVIQKNESEIIFCKVVIKNKQTGFS